MRRVDERRGRGKKWRKKGEMGRREEKGERKREHRRIVNYSG